MFTELLCQHDERFSAWNTGMLQAFCMLKETACPVSCSGGKCCWHRGESALIKCFLSSPQCVVSQYLIHIITTTYFAL